MRTLSSSATPLHTLPTLLHGFFGDGLHMLGLLLVHPHSCISVSSCPRWGLPVLMECLCKCPGRLLHTEPQHPGCLCRLQLVLALSMYQSAWH